MLLLSRRPGESIIILQDDKEIVRFTLLKTIGNQTRIGFDADKDITILREELYRKMLIEKINKYEGQKQVVGLL
jgi:carbon storage regulator CsrA